MCLVNTRYNVSFRNIVSSLIERITIRIMRPTPSSDTSILKNITWHVINFKDTALPTHNTYHDTNSSDTALSTYRDNNSSGTGLPNLLHIMRQALPIHIRQFSCLTINNEIKGKFVGQYFCSMNFPYFF